MSGKFLFFSFGFTIPRLFRKLPIWFTRNRRSKVEKVRGVHHLFDAIYIWLWILLQVRILKYQGGEDPRFDSTSAAFPFS